MATVTYGITLEGIVLNAGSGANAIAVQSASIVTPMTINAGDGADTITLGVSSLFAIWLGVTIDGGAGTDTVVSPHDGNTWRITAANAGTVTRTIGVSTFSAVENLRGGAYTDVFILSNGVGVSGSLDGEGGVDLLDYSAYAAANPVTVDLTVGTATGAAGGVFDIENVTGGAGNDSLTGSTANNILRGGAGHDILSGLAGHDMLFGGDGDDLLLGGAGRDFLVGGLGSDTCDGGADDDILVGGSTAYDNNGFALNAIMAEWTNLDVSYLDRINHLLNGGGRNGTTRLTAAQIADDGVADKLTGNTELDWFFARVPPDATDAAPGERIN
jgi:Ca2+-binding RTX toxin-like protein